MGTFYGINYTNELLDAIDKITPSNIQCAAKMILDKPSVISVVANKETLDKNKEYLFSLGEVQNY